MSRERERETKARNLINFHHYDGFVITDNIAWLEMYATGCMLQDTLTR